MLPSPPPPLHSHSHPPSSPYILRAAAQMPVSLLPSCSPSEWEAGTPKLSPSQLLHCRSWRLWSWRLFPGRVLLIPAATTTSSLSRSPGKLCLAHPGQLGLASITSPIITLQALADISRLIDFK